MTDDTGNDGIDRRRALSRIGAAATAGIAGIAGFQYFTRPVFAIDAESLSAADVDIASDDGRIEDVFLKPDLTYSWDGLDADPEEIEFVVSIEEGVDDGDYEGLGSETADLSSTGRDVTDGSYAFEKQLSLVRDGPWDRDDFRSGRDGTTRTVGPIGVRIGGYLETDDGEYSDTKTAEFSVNVTNNSVEFGSGGGGNDSTGGGIGGDAGTGGS